MNGSGHSSGSRNRSPDRSMVKFTVNLCVIDKGEVLQGAGGGELPSSETDAEHARWTGMVEANRGGLPSET